MTIESILPVPEIFSARRVLCFQPHYDDNDIGAGGTIARLAQNGAEIVYLTMTDDLMGLVDRSLSDTEAAKRLKRDQEKAGAIIGVKEQHWLNYPDAGRHDPFDLRRDVLKYIRRLQPDLILAPDPWLTYEAHRDHLEAGMAAAEAVAFAGLPKIPSGDPQVDAAYTGHVMLGVAFYYTREPNRIVDVSSTWDLKISAVKKYEAQFTAESMDEVVMALEFKSRQVCTDQNFKHGEPLKILPPQALHCGI